jgi:hypothetical protein
MSNPRRDDEAYEPPAVEEREPIDTPLVAVTSGEPASAAFHPGDDAPEHDAPEYDAPAIEERETIETALIGAIGSDEPQVSAAFHPADSTDVYEPPAIDEREPIDTPLVAAIGSGPVCVATH